MLNNYLNAIKNRRTYYKISNENVSTDSEIQNMLETVVKHTPSAFNSQSARVVLLLGENHNKLWEITKNKLKAIVSKENFKSTEEKINSFKSGYGTILFFEDTEIIKNLQKQFETYKNNFTIWSKESSGMNQYNVWTSLELMGFGASLQHYNELIENDIKKEFDLPETWEMRAQMPFGKPIETPSDKDFEPMKNRVIIKK